MHDDSGVPPLSDVTVVDLTQVLAGPFATMTLGDLGAEVLKIEAVGRGDRSRAIGPIPEYFDTVNRNKHSVAVDLKSEEGQAVVLDLLADADVFVESTKPGRIDRFNLAYDDVAAVNPEIIYCSITGFGRESPYSDLPAWDMLIQGMSGIMSMTGERDGQPVWSGLPSGDLAAGMYTVGSVLAALFARSEGAIEGEWIEVPMLDAAISWLSVRAGHSFGTGEPFPRSGTRHPSIAPFGVFQCADGPIVIAAGTGDFWAGFCRALDREDLVDDDRFASIEDRLENREALLDEVDPILAAEPGDRWIDAMREEGVPAGPIYDTATVWNDRHVRSRELRCTMDREDRQDAEVIDHPVHFTQLASELRTPPENLGESTDAILSRHGYSTEEIRELRDRNVVG